MNYKIVAKVVTKAKAVSKVIMIVNLNIKVMASRMRLNIVCRISKIL